MNSGVDELYLRKKVVLVQTNENTHAHIDNRHVLLHYKRLIHLLLNSISFDRSNENIYAGRIEFNLHKDDFDFLKAFTDNSDDTVGTFNKIDEIISRQFKKSKLSEYIETYLTWTDHIYLHCFNKGTALLVIAAFAMYFVLRLLREKYPLWYVFKLIIFILWIFDILLTYMQLSSEEEANTMADTAKFASLPMSCKQQNMNWWQVAWNSMVGRDDCREYYKTMLRKEIYLVTPLMVLSHQVGVVVATPAYKIGTALGNFCSGIMGEHNKFYIPKHSFHFVILFHSITICFYKKRTVHTHIQN